MIVISIHGRKGQGVETAVKTLAKAAHTSNFHVQSIFFPSSKSSREWGLVKIDKNFILSKQKEHSDIALVFETRQDNKNVISNIKTKGIVIFNSSEKIVTPQLKKAGIKSYFLDATTIGIGHMNKPLTDMSMLGALAKYFNKITLKSLKSASADVYKDAGSSIDEGYKSVG
ncbi:2-oxoacid:acceptor oxidoreductase family protein [archaeon]|nr:2-oxoacid:acceptor oxidoreductase family protein [archaeon]